MLQLCMIQKQPDARIHFHESIRAPYLITNDEFIAYDDTRSIQIKVSFLHL